MTYNIRTADKNVVAAPTSLSAPAVAAVAGPSHPERRDWRKRRKVRVRRAAELRNA